MGVLVHVHVYLWPHRAFFSVVPFSLSVYQVFSVCDIRMFSVHLSKFWGISPPSPLLQYKYTNTFWCHHYQNKGFWGRRNIVLVDQLYSTRYLVIISSALLMWNCAVILEKVCNFKYKYVVKWYLDNRLFHSIWLTCKIPAFTNYQIVERLISPVVNRQFAKFSRC